MTTSFRKSEFIDFDTGEVAASPMVLINHLQQPWSPDTKIYVFHFRVDVWQLGPAVQILKEIEHHEHPSAWSHSAYGLLSVIISYFEMIGKTLNPTSKKTGTAGPDFFAGFSDVYPEYGYSRHTVDQFWNRLRNGLYHLAATKAALLIHNCPAKTTRDFDVIPEMTTSGTTIECYYVNPHSMVRTVVNHFPTFIERLRNPDPKYDNMRAKFENFIGDYHEV